MSNDFYNVSGAPSQGSFGSSATIRAEFAALQAGFDKLPVLAANNSKLLRVNSSASGLEAFTHDFLTTAAAAAAYVAKAGDTMTGTLTINAPAASRAIYASGVAGQAVAVFRQNAATIAYISIAGNNATPGTNSFDLQQDAASAVDIVQRANARMSLYTNNAERVQVAATGNVTINAPSSGLALNVAGVPGTYTQEWTANSVTAALLESSSIYYFGTKTSSTLGLMTAATSRLTINNTGNVTINAPSSGIAVTVNGISGNNHQVWTDGTVQVGVQTAGGTAAYIGSVTNHRFELFTNNTSRIVVSTTGNVTVNAPSTGDAFKATSPAASSYAVQALAIASTDNALSAYFGQSGGNNTRIQISHNNSDGVSRIDFTGSGSAEGRIARGGTDVISINGSRQVTVAAPASGTAVVINNVSGQRNLQLTGASGSAAFFSIIDGQTGTREWQINVGNSSIGQFEIRDSTAGSDRLRISTAGAVNIVAGSGNLLMGGNITRFESAELTCPSGAAGTTSVAHGGPRAPDVVYAVLRCKTAELNWAVGDEVDLGSDFDGSTAVGNYIAANATTCYFGSSNTPAVRNRTTTTLGTVTPANWRVVFRCLWF